MKDVTNATGGDNCCISGSKRWLPCFCFDVPVAYFQRITEERLLVSLWILDFWMGLFCITLWKSRFTTLWFLTAKFLNLMCRYNRKDISFLIRMILFLYWGENRSEKWEKLDVFLCVIRGIRKEHKVFSSCLEWVPRRFIPHLCWVPGVFFNYQQLLKLCCKKVKLPFILHQLEATAYWVQKWGA